jgi:hypothetical protein
MMLGHAKVCLNPTLSKNQGGLLSAMVGLVLFVDGLRVAIMPMSVKSIMPAYRMP